MDDRRSGVGFRAVEKIFLFATQSRPICGSMGTGGYFPRGSSCRGVTTHLCLVQKVDWSYTSTRRQSLTASCGVNPLHQRCTRFLHACSALCKRANWLCRTCTPHHTVAGRSSVSLTQSNSRGPPLASYMPGRSIQCTRARHSITHHRTLCTACAPLLYMHSDS
jgi:hypothetical protein